MKRLFTALVWMVLLLSSVACTTTPTQHSLSATDRNAVLNHQQQLQGLDSWRLRGQLALFDLAQDKRHSVYMDWQHSPALTQIRFSHPLQGTLARLEQTPAGAVLIDDADNRYYGRDAESLLRDYFDLALPFNLVTDLVVGRETATMQQQHYIVMADQNPTIALLSGYAIPANGQLWRAQLNQYKMVQHTQLPHQFELEASEWRIKLRVNQWQF